MIFTLLILFIIFMYFFKDYIKEKKYCVFVYIALIFISGLRGSSVGTDTPGYVYAVVNANRLTLDTFFEYLQNREPLYHIVRDIIASLSDNYTLFLMIIAIFFCSVICVFVYKYSNNHALSFLMFISMGYFYFSMSGIRQTIAMGFLILAFMAINENKRVTGIVLIAIATGFHITSLVFLLIYIIDLLPLNGYYLGIISVISAIFFSSGGSIIMSLAERIWADDRGYTSNEFGGTSILYLLILISVCLLIFYWNDIRADNMLKIKKRKNNKLQPNYNMDILPIKMIILSVPFQVLAIHQANAFRVAMIFHIVSIISVPNAVKKVNEPVIRSVATIMIGVLLLVQFYLVTYYTAGIIPYKFCWEA